MVHNVIKDKFGESLKCLLNCIPVGPDGVVLPPRPLPPLSLGHLQLRRVNQLRTLLLILGIFHPEAGDNVAELVRVHLAF